MFRRLHFLLPNVKLAQKVVDELSALGVSHKQIHTVADEGNDIGSLPPATPNQRRDKTKRIENIAWSGNLLLFFSTLVVFVAAVAYGNYILAILCIAVMLVSFSLGSFFIHHMPRVHVDQFKHALSHRELLLMVDVPDTQAYNIENNIHRHHPAAYEGGSTWTLKSADI